MAKSPIYPRTLSIGLALSAPGATDPGMEVAAPGYARQLARFDLASGQANALTNIAAVQWPRAASLWGTIGWLTVWDDGAYAGWGNLVSVSDGVTRPATVRINAGDAARFGVGAVLATDRYGPSLYGAGLFGAGLYSSGTRSPPRPYSRGSYSAGPYSRNPHALNVIGAMATTFTADSPCCPDAATWTPDAPCGGAWTMIEPCPAAPRWALEPLP